MSSLTKTAFEVTKPILIAGLLGGAGVILLVGLLCGLVARPNNCIEPTSPPITSPSPSTGQTTNNQTSILTGSITTRTATSKINLS